MSARPDVAMAQLRPFWGRATVIESAVDETERPSGLILPISSDNVRRGVVLDVAELGFASEAASLLATGCVVYFRGGTKIGDVYVVELHDVLAFIPGEA